MIYHVELSENTNKTVKIAVDAKNKEEAANIATKMYAENQAQNVISYTHNITVKIEEDHNAD